MSFGLAAALVALAPPVAALAHDEDAQSGDESPAPPPSARLEWNDDWARFRPWEYVATGAAWTEALFMRFAGPSPAPQRGTFGVDVQIVEALTLHGTRRIVAGTIADVGYIGSMVYTLADATIVPGIVWNSPDVALQMTMIDLEAFALVAVVIWNAQLIYARERPKYRDCPDPALAPDPADGSCANRSDSRHRSFIAGHTAIATTAAGLACVHHAHLPLYGGGVADDLACGGMIALAALVGISRITTELHYPTDTLLAWTLGFLAGYVLPSALHYGFGRDTTAARAQARSSSRPDRIRFTLIPRANAEELGASAIGVF